MTRTVRSVRPIRDALRGAAAAIATGVLIAGVPVGLWRLVGWPLPATIPDWDRLVAALSDSYIPDDILVNALAVVCWLSWAQIVVALAVETAAVVAGRPTPRLPLARPAQILAARLITAIALLGTLTATRTTPVDAALTSAVVVETAPAALAHDANVDEPHPRAAISETRKQATPHHTRPTIPRRTPHTRPTTARAPTPTRRPHQPNGRRDHPRLPPSTRHQHPRRLHIRPPTPRRQPPRTRHLEASTAIPATTQQTLPCCGCHPDRSSARRWPRASPPRWRSPACTVAAATSPRHRRPASHTTIHTPTPRSAASTATTTRPTATTMGDRSPTGPHRRRASPPPH